MGQFAQIIGAASGIYQAVRVKARATLEAGDAPDPDVLALTLALPALRSYNPMIRGVPLLDDESRVLLAKALARIALAAARGAVAETALASTESA